MKMRLVLMAATILMLATAASAQYRCGNTTNEIVECYGYFGCHDYYPYSMNNRPGPYFLEQRSTMCCGIGQNYWAWIDDCLYVELKDPKKNSQLLELAMKQDLLVPSCDGTLLPAYVVLKTEPTGQVPLVSRNRITKP